MNSINTHPMTQTRGIIRGKLWLFARPGYTAKGRGNYLGVASFENILPDQTAVQSLMDTFIQCGFIVPSLALVTEGMHNFG
jgi:hypothetical protein